MHGSGHSRGAAIDVTLVNISTGQELQMPSAFDEFSKKAHRNYDYCADEVRENVIFLESVLRIHNF